MISLILLLGHDIAKVFLFTDATRVTIKSYNLFKCQFEVQWDLYNSMVSNRCKKKMIMLKINNKLSISDIVYFVACISNIILLEMYALHVVFVYISISSIV